MTELRLERDDRTWIVGVEWGEVDGAVEAVGLVLRQPSDAQRPITASALRRLQPAAVIAAARQQRYEALGGSMVEAYRAAEAGDPDNAHLLDDVSPGLVDHAERGSAPWGPNGRGRPKEYGEEHFEDVARIYNEAVDSGRYPLQAVMETRFVTRSTASRWVRQARDRGLLPATSQGKMGRGSQMEGPR
ncbi:hypothetical protein [Nocardioides nanhaiensis]|uniref:hypothetical protein n=1 Tax=Nocardioides nanhaiensis TaxID=1476871 RepID=UPI0031F02335